MVVEVGGENNRKQTPGRLPRMKKFSLLNYPIISPIQKGVPSVNRRKQSATHPKAVFPQVSCSRTKAVPSGSIYPHVHLQSCEK